VEIDTAENNCTPTDLLRRRQLNASDFNVKDNSLVCFVAAQNVFVCIHVAYQEKTKGTKSC